MIHIHIHLSQFQSGRNDSLIILNVVLSFGVVSKLCLWIKFLKDFKLKELKLEPFNNALIGFRH